MIDKALSVVGTLESVQVGTPHRYGTPRARDEMDRLWSTSFFRKPTPEPRWLYTTHLEGNAQADTKNHGKPDQAVLMYAASNYPLWREELGRPEMGAGGFAENFTVSELSEQTACVGDTYGIGDALIQVSGPRYPCSKIERRWGIPGLTDRVAATGRTGWYCRVLREGLVAPGMAVTLVERPYPEWTIAMVNDLGHGRNKDRATVKALASCHLINDFWPKLALRRATGRD